jgi:dolichol-phosphate mannosyltransferase
MQAEIAHRRGWEVPAYEVRCFSPKSTRYCIAIPVINEGERILGQLGRMRDAGLLKQADTLLLDGGSTDGSMDPDRLRSFGVRALLVKTGPGKQGAQLRMGWSWALEEGYEGIITLDGNGKDGIEAIPRFVEALDRGFDFVQGSRYVAGGAAIRTPLIRALAIALIHVPIIRLASGFSYTDTTNAFRGYSRRLLLDSEVQPFREVFQTYEMLAYLSVRAPELGFRVTEIPVRREYPTDGKIPTKISFFEGNTRLIKILWKVLRHEFNPERAQTKSCHDPEHLRRGCRNCKRDVRSPVSHF